VIPAPNPRRRASDVAIARRRGDSAGEGAAAIRRVRARLAGSTVAGAFTMNPPNTMVDEKSVTSS
jgi:hypothetical protein